MQLHSLTKAVGSVLRLALLGLLAFLVSPLGCEGNIENARPGEGTEAGPVPVCTGGTDKDGDGYGKGCPAGEDCDDNDLATHPGAKEACDGKDNDCNGKKDDGALNACGTCDPGCDSLGKSGAFPTDKTKDPKVKDSTGVGVDGNGDLVLDKTKKDFNYMWIANTLGTKGSTGGCTYAISSGYKSSLDAYCRGTVSKIDTKNRKEVGRYFSITCYSKPGTTGCVDINGKTIKKNFPHAPSRTAVDYNFDVWVANRAFGGQPSATKIANDTADCIDRNGNGKIDTSKDQDGDGKINVDCDGNGVPDGSSTKCTSGKTPEFLGDDDECVVMTVNYAGNNEYGRSICLDAGKSMVGASNVWVGTYNRSGNNRFYKIDGSTGKIETAATIDLPAGHYAYGCTSDGYSHIWSTYGGGNLAFFSAVSPYQVGPLVTSPKTVKVSGASAYHYGIATDSKGYIWLGGSSSCRMLRYKPDRTSFSTLSQGKWTLFHVPCYGTSSGSTTTTRGVAPDDRGKVWMALTSGYIVRVDQSLGDGEHDLRTTKYIWKTDADGVIGAGVDFAGNVWGIGYSNNMASMLEVDKQGTVLNSGKTKNVTVGQNPYTYSDFTGYGLLNFIRPQGRYVYQFSPCATGKKARWKKVLWTATKPTGTSVVVRVRSGDSDVSMGSWSSAFYTSPALIDPASSTAVSPNPSVLLEVELTLKTNLSATTPTVHDLALAYDCSGTPG